MTWKKKILIMLIYKHGWYTVLDVQALTQMRLLL